MSDHGRWIWYELITPDMEGAKAFYGALVGWTAQDMPPMPGAEPYSIMSAGGNGVAGFMHLGDVGSSRVDLQACKLEYSIVSPK